ncbi:helix-turn-helix domain-containing protein [Rhodococcus hoagii]|nr:helix-turn-helix domain-containing protein [Prescottella equi]NKV87968.1 helix-turn-helix domain-containing protein [Prescottella equi]
MNVTQMLKPAEAAAFAKCSPGMIYAALQSGELRGFQRRKPNGRWMIDPADLDRWLRADS